MITALRSPLEQIDLLPEFEDLKEAPDDNLRLEALKLLIAIIHCLTVDIHYLTDSALGISSDCSLIVSKTSQNDLSRVG